MTHLPELSPATWLFMALYLAVGAGLFVYGVHAYLMSWLYRKHEGRATSGKEGFEGAAHPIVTVQLPIFNEFYVVERLVEAVAAFDWPRDRLEIQILDDSTDDTVERVATLVARRREQGFQIEQVRRDCRTGYKGGALREGLALAGGEYVAVFDADFVPPPDFLTATIPHFADAQVGMVQARWGHMNEEYSLLTRAQAVALDGHFLIEQTARNRSGAFINFNGTAGIWRRATIEDAGNWQDDTLTEDLDLSYRAQLKGWRFVFLPGLVCQAELPVDIDGFKGQQFRWAKGSVQTAMKLLPELLRSRVGIFVKVQALIHLTNHAVYPLLLLLAIFSLPALILHANEPLVRRFFVVATFFVIASLGHPLLYLDAQRRLKRDWPRQLALMPILIALGMGIAVNNVRAVIEALAGVPSGFNRTPKYDLRQSSDKWRGKRYRVPVNAWPLLELALGAWTGAALVYSVWHGQWLAAPFLALYTAGLVSVGGASLARAFDSPGGIARTA
ncbi:MAG: glycosyltransferase [Candidatus Eisenbacteria bacterium]|nr:glycosyltransferase [Candidatus Eisenbacteria bacterium]